MYHVMDLKVIHCFACSAIFIPQLLQFELVAIHCDGTMFLFGYRQTDANQ